MRSLNLAFGALVPALALAAPLSAAAQGELVVYCTVQEEWCRPMVAAFEKATGIKVLDDAQELGRVLRADQGRGRQSAGRHLVGRHRRSASAGGRGRPDRAVQVAEAWPSCRTGRCARGAVEGPHGRRLRRRARLQLQHRAAEEEEHSASPSAGPTSSSPPSRTRSRSPTRIRRAPRTRCSRRSCRSWARTRRSST